MVGMNIPSCWKRGVYLPRVWMYLPGYFSLHGGYEHPVLLEERGIPRKHHLERTLLYQLDLIVLIQLLKTWNIKTHQRLSSYRWQAELFFLQHISRHWYPCFRYLVTVAWDRKLALGFEPRLLVHRQAPQLTKLSGLYCMIHPCEQTLANFARINSSELTR